MRSVDLLITGGQVVIGDPADGQVRVASLAVDDGRIIDIASEEVILNTYTSKERIDANRSLIFPGFVSTHAHLFQSLLKGLGRDLPLLQWLDASVRRALHCYDRQAMSAASELGLSQLISSGVTTVVDYQYCHSEPLIDTAVADACIKLGIRSEIHSSRTDVSGYPADFALSYRESEREYLDQLHVLREIYKDSPLISIGAAPGIIWDMSTEGYQELAKISSETGMNISMHCNETLDDLSYSIDRYGKPLMNVLEECGILSKRFTAVHAVNMSEEDLQIVSDRQVSISHCPIPNMILGSGAADIQRFKESGINVSLAVDGAASNDSQNMFETVKMAALLSKLIRRDPSISSASDILSMATLGGARAIGMDSLIGSIEVGKQADLCLYALDSLYSCPVNDPIASLVYSAAPSGLSKVLVSGKVIFEDGQLVRDDIEQVVSRATEAVGRIRRMADI